MSDESKDSDEQEKQAEISTRKILLLKIKQFL